MRCRSNLMIFVAFLSFQSAFAGVSAQAEELQCAFACKEIPPDSEVPRKFGQSTTAHLNDRRIQVLVWNLYKGKLSGYPSAFEELTRETDIVMVSEAITENPVKATFDSLPHFGWDFSTSFLLKNQVGTGTAVGSYAQALEVAHFRTKDVEPFSNTPKAITAVKYALPLVKESLLVLSIHGINWSGDEAIVRQVQDTIPLIAAHSGPILYAGDFNFKNQTRRKSISQLLAPYGLSIIPWENPITNKAQLDDGYSRGLKIHRAYINSDHDGEGSDHPALELDVEVVDKSSQPENQTTTVSHYLSISQ
jgi:endonuclease/exonuclease/phosphatase (EEP) superfamily protein YafD